MVDKERYEVYEEEPNIGHVIKSREENGPIAHSQSVKYRHYKLRTKRNLSTKCNQSKIEQAHHPSRK